MSSPTSKRAFGKRVDDHDRFEDAADSSIGGGGRRSRERSKTEQTKPRRDSIRDVDQRSIDRSSSGTPERKRTWLSERPKRY